MFDRFDEGRHRRTARRAAISADKDTDGFFPEGSMMRQMGKEALGLLGGGRAILLQLAHPLVAAGVDDHSDFQRDPLERLLGTLKLMHTLVFGSRCEAQQAQRRFHTVHAKIRGRLRHSVGHFPAGTTYRGDDPALKLWVAATLIDTGLATYSHFVAPLDSVDCRRYYTDALRMTALMEIPAEIMPQSLEAFRAYMREMLAGDTLAVDSRARRLARDVFQPGDVGIVRAGCAGLLRFVGAGLLPPHLRAAYGLRWNARRQWLLHGLGSMTRRLRPVVPKWIWQSPQQGPTLARLLLWGVTTDS